VKNVPDPFPVSNKIFYDNVLNASYDMKEKEKNLKK
jgi:hypothetical protein